MSPDVVLGHENGDIVPKDVCLRMQFVTLFVKMQAVRVVGLSSTILIVSCLAILVSCLCSDVAIFLASSEELFTADGTRTDASEQLWLAEAMAEPMLTGVHKIARVSAASNVLQQLPQCRNAFLLSSDVSEFRLPMSG